MKKKIKSAENVERSDKLQYHIGLRPKDVVNNILLCGDPARVKLVAEEMLDDVSEEISHREFFTVTGKWCGVPVTAMATGMGPDNMEIAVIELSQIVKNPTFIRVGSCGAINRNIGLGDHIITTGAVRLENTSTSYVMDGYPAVAHHEVVLALLEASGRLNAKSFLGITATTSSFYGGQARKISGFPIVNENLVEQLEKMNVLNFEMETSCLLTLASLAKFRAGTICFSMDNRIKNTFIDDRKKIISEKECLKIGLTAFEVLHKMDLAKKRSEHWIPSMGI